MHICQKETGVSTVWTTLKSYICVFSQFSPEVLVRVKNGVRTPTTSRTNLFLKVLASPDVLRLILFPGQVIKSIVSTTPDVFVAVRMAFSLSGFEHFDERTIAESFAMAVELCS